ncbi:MarR family winged helix-turn-helix transcriptional regulator [Kitasatospora purpeofusca]|uniref:MarR family winged helix-turn-helix transcriptional regulator n=1 Tax=Kitasatospora purpeofusca TaxID=67352 RepID=UPI002254AB1E|nr:MarR family winged helix-turn-helix transcriptional regulator [Kitasatospora purpeofusca]MCX4756144.1 MarR family winged helix-turn-helix transcriptional regulator [Kitasatospora purpeofusca]WSR36022.1 MarR family winged helix-turn-helix transcriptional regulator [Kitasatospora purpeofusca]WSR44314.1 MarR family winged helix-turn-helix transcriptional regulator [Kitasatospora purpeofusca]
MSAVAPDPPDPALGEEFSTLLVGIQRLVRRRLREGRAEPRLRGAQVELLRLVTDCPGLRVSDAAAELCLAANSVSTLVNQLVALGLLRREVDPADRRAALLYTTGEAVERLAAWRARREALVGEVVAGLPAADRAALAAALPALRGVATGLRERAGEPGTAAPAAGGRTGP